MPARAGSSVPVISSSGISRIIPPALARGDSPTTSSLAEQRLRRVTVCTTAARRRARRARANAFSASARGEPVGSMVSPSSGEVAPAAGEGRPLHITATSPIPLRAMRHRSGRRGQGPPLRSPRRRRRRPAGGASPVVWTCPMSDQLPDLRATDADRERVADRLRTAAAEGQLTFDELDERLNAAYAARTGRELEPLTADLQEGALAATGTTGRTGLTVRRGPG